MIMKLMYQWNEGLITGKEYNIICIKEYKNTQTFQPDKIIRKYSDFNIFDYLNSDKYYEVYLRDEDNTLVSTELEDFEFLEYYRSEVIDEILQ